MKTKNSSYFDIILHLQFEKNASPVYIHKRLDIEVNKKVEHKSFHLGIPVQDSKHGKNFQFF